MLNKIVLWVILIAPWFTLFFLKKEEIKRYMPAAIFASFLMTIYNNFAYNQAHWELKVSIIPSLDPLFVSGVFGAFPVITLWVFHFTYGRFGAYLLTNIVIDFMFAVFPIHYVFQEILGIYKLMNISALERFFLFVFFSVVLYGFYKWQEGIFRPNVRPSQNK
ncbi:hypothetical protein ABN702_16530 [Bacillus haimaensis]|uniref:hypothetical protein n=1 Tax=Bacillus haimaensis TaxID=3160967 RepID=UPI003AA7E183